MEGSAEVGALSKRTKSHQEQVECKDPRKVQDWHGHCFAAGLPPHDWSHSLTINTSGSMKTAERAGIMCVFEASMYLQAQLRLPSSEPANLAFDLIRSLELMG